jgi:toxin ParE1/3/4
MVEIIWTEPALLDLDDITLYIALDNPYAAGKLVKKIEKHVLRLKDFPLSGRNLPEFIETKYKEIIVPPCRIIYLFQDEKIIIIHIIRSERNLRRFLLDDNTVHENKTQYEKD